MSYIVLGILGTNTGSATAPPASTPDAIATVVRVAPPIAVAALVVRPTAVVTREAP